MIRCIQLSVGPTRLTTQNQGSDRPDSSLTARIDQKVSNSPSGFKLQEAQAILSEVRSIRDAISSGEKEKQELMQVNAAHHV